MTPVTSIADIRGTVKPLAAFFHKVFTMLVTRRTGSTLDMTEDDLFADIFLLAVKAVETEVFGIQEEPLAGIEVRQTVGADFFGSGTGIFTEVAGDLLEGSTGIQLAFNVSLFAEVGCLWFPGINLLMMSPSTAVRGKDIITYMQD